MADFELQKVKGAIRTDFILSAEIIVIALGTVQGTSLALRLSVVTSIVLLMTVEVYGLVGLIVKLDDIGLYLLQKPDGSALRRAVGQGAAGDGAPSDVPAGTGRHHRHVYGGGGILVHGLPFTHHLIEGAAAVVATLSTVGAVLAAVTPPLLNAVVGVVAGLLLVAVMTLVSRLAPAKG